MSNLHGWKNLMNKFKTFFDSKLESDWEKSTNHPSGEWDKVIKHKGVI